MIVDLFCFFAYCYSMGPPWVFMKGSGLSCHPVNPFQKAERITVKQKFFATQDDKTHGWRVFTFSLTPPKKIVEQTNLPHSIIPDPFLLWILELLKFSFEEDPDGFFLLRGPFIFNFYGSTVVRYWVSHNFWNKANNGCIVNNPSWIDY